MNQTLSIKTNSRNSCIMFKEAMGMEWAMHTSKQSTREVSIVFEKVAATTYKLCRGNPSLELLSTKNLTMNKQISPTV